MWHQLPIPGEQGIRLGHASDLLQGFTAESCGDLGQCGSLGIGQPESSGQVCSENGILGRQDRFAAIIPILVDKTCHKGQNACPMNLIAHGKNPS